ncbi:MAG: DUF192 domain-containing protein [Bacillota bacterium]|nr:DUF192 domain-containing protein [Bacillota bacterium]
MMKAKSITYKVINETKQQTLGWQVEIASTFFTRLKGLLGRPELAIGSGLIIKPSNSIHSFFMKFSFDAIFLDDKNDIIYVVEELAPGKIVKPVANAVQVIELPAGTIRLTGTATGDVLKVTKCSND